MRKNDAAPEPSTITVSPFAVALLHQARDLFRLLPVHLAEELDALKRRDRITGRWARRHFIALLPRRDGAALQHV